MKTQVVVVNQNATGDVEVIECGLRPLEYDEALVEVEYCGMCHADLHVVVGDCDEEPGRVLRCEGIGVVRKVAPGVNALKIGDRVSITWSFQGYDSCEYCNIGRETLYRSVLNAGYTTDGDMATHCIVDADYAARVLNDLDPAQASGITCADVITYKGVKVPGVHLGQWITVYGTGNLGNLGVQHAKKMSGVYVVAIDISGEELAFAKESGADLVINAAKEGAAKVIQRKTGGAHAAAVTVISAATFSSVVDCVRAGGRIVVIDLPPESMDLSIPRLVLDGVEVISSLVDTCKDLEEAFQFDAEGLVAPKVQLRALNEAPAIFQEMHKDKITGRMVIDVKRECGCGYH